MFKRIKFTTVLALVLAIVMTMALSGCALDKTFSPHPKGDVFRQGLALAAHAQFIANPGDAEIVVKVLKPLALATADGEYTTLDKFKDLILARADVENLSSAQIKRLKPLFTDFMNQLGKEVQIESSVFTYDSVRLRPAIGRLLEIAELYVKS